VEGISPPSTNALILQKRAPRAEDIMPSEVATKGGSKNLELLISGKWRESESQDLHAVFNPAEGRVIASVPFSTREEVSEAVGAADDAFASWSSLPITERIQFLFRMKDVLELHARELAILNTENHGKTLEESQGDIRRTIENVESAISIAYTLAKGTSLDQISPGIDEVMVKEPLGVFAMVCPFNFPVLIPFWFLPYALVLGDTVVMKPSEITPVPMQRVAALIQEEVRLPPGVLNLVHGGAEVVETLIGLRALKGVTFVGSTPVARRVYRLAGENGKRAIVNGGAKNSIVVMPDADLDRSIPSIISSFFGNTGQRCLAGANLVVVAGEQNKLLNKFSKAASALRIGNGLSPGTEMGPLVTMSAKERVQAYVQKGIDEGGKIVIDGRNARVKEFPDGFYLGSTIFDDVSPSMSIAQDEVFGPLASVLHVDILDEALDLVNRRTNYGNMASIFTSSGRAAREFRRQANAGNIGINIGVAAPSAFYPFGGMRDSFFGVAHPQADTVDFFTDRKVVLSRW
jgi:malonate-semialdehyde dehydrogenase (acetylating)/methylmalonate-semialdehyde dehydrogenase